MPLAAIAAELTEARLDALATGDNATDLRAVFSWSCHNLSRPAAGLFRSLGVHPGPDISVAAAAGITGRSLHETRRALAELTDSHLIQEAPGGRYVCHDLLRAYAAEEARACGEPTCRTTICRLLDHYLCAAHAADQVLFPTRDQISLPSPQPGTTPESFPSEQQALAWFDAEHQVLLAAIGTAAANGFNTHAWQLAHALETFFYRRGHWHDWAATQRAALTAAEHANDNPARAYTHRAIGSASIQLRSYDDAFYHNSQALSFYKETGDRIGQARVHLENGRAYDRQGMYRESIHHSKQAMRLFRMAGHQAGLSASLNQAGWAYALLGDYERAVTMCQEALILSQASGDHHFEPAIADSLGYAHYHLGNHAQAGAFYRQALRQLEKNGAPAQRAETLSYMGNALYAAGDPQAAREAWQEALTILDRLQEPDSYQLRVKLQRLDAGAVPAPMNRRGRP